MYGRSTHATPVTRHVPLLLTVLVSAAIHMLLLAAGWALIRANHETSQGSSSLTLILDDGQSATLPEPSIRPIPSSNTDSAPVESAASPETFTAAEPRPVVEQVVTTTADSRPALANRAVVNQSQTQPATEMLMPAEPAQIAAQTAAQTAVLADRPAPRSDSPEQINEMPPEVQMLNLFEQMRLQQVLDQLADLDIPALNQTTEIISLPDGSQVAVDVRAVTAPGLTDLASYEVILSQRQDDQLFSTRAILRERAFSWYAKFINRWDADVVLADDRVVGRFHSNTPVNFSTDRRRQPVFSGPVSLADYQTIGRRIRNSGMFQQGIDTGVGRISMPEAVVPTVFTLAETSLEVHQFTEHTRLEFLADGGVAWSQSGTRSGLIRPAPGNAMLIVAVENAVLELSGVVSGVVSVFAPHRLSIIGNLTYAGDVTTGNDPQHFLTLISNGIIEVGSPVQTGPGDLEIQAALFARQRFSVRRFNSRPQGELIIRGTLVAGSVSATEPRYTTRIEYDSRFESVRPPAFPTTGLFDIADWDKQWHIIAVSDDSPVIDPDMIQPLAGE